jgi:signal transduction histidine kinase/putative methionine-R-sulfoxide reductase with GAF domain
MAAGLVKSAVWHTPEGLLISLLASISLLDAVHKRNREPWREPLVSMLIDAVVIFLAMGLADVPESALGIPFAYLLLTSMMLLRFGAAMLVLVMAGLMFATVVLADTPLGPAPVGWHGAVSGILTDLLFTLAIIALVRVMFRIMNRDRIRRRHRILMQNAITEASRALLSGPGVDPIDEALQALLDATDATAVFVEQNVEDADLGLCSSLVAEALKPTTQPDPEEMWDLVPWSVMSGREALESGDGHSLVVSELRGKERELYDGSGVRSELDLPIMANGAWWGLIGFTDVYEERPWAKDDQHLLRTAAEMIGAYVERGIARDELARQLDYHHALAECATALQTFGDDEALDVALAALLGATEADHAYIDENYNDPIEGPSARVIHEAETRDTPPTRGQKEHTEWWCAPHSDMPTSTDALRAGRPVQILTRDLVGRERELYEADAILSELCLPIVVNGQWAGSIAFADYQHERTFSELEIKVLTTAARMVGAFWERRRTDRELKSLVASQEVRLRYESAIAECSRALLMSGDESAVAVALRHLMTATGTHDVFVDRNTVDPLLGLVGEVTHELIREGYREVVDEEIWFDEDTGSVRKSRTPYGDLPSLRSRLEMGLPVVVVPAELPVDERRIYGPDACKSELNIPIMANDRWLGSIGFADYLEQREWVSGEIALLQTVAEMIGAFWERNDSRRTLEELIRSKDDFVASVSHELRTPLTSVVGLSHELSNRYGDFAEDEAGSLIAIVAEQSTEVANIIDDLLVAARADIGTLVIEPTVVDIHETVDGILKTGFTDRFEDADVTGLKVKAWADPTRFRQILRNLIGNAARYGGNALRVSTAIEKSLVMVTVADSGLGVDEDLVQSIFEPYARAHHEVSQPASVGLGLAVARDLARLMDGDIVYRRVASWTEFVLSLPVADTAGADFNSFEPVGLSRSTHTTVSIDV